MTQQNEKMLKALLCFPNKKNKSSGDHIQQKKPKQLNFSNFNGVT